MSISLHSPIAFTLWIGEIRWASNISQGQPLGPLDPREVKENNSSCVYRIFNGIMRSFHQIRREWIGKKDPEWADPLFVNPYPLRLMR